MRVSLTALAAASAVERQSLLVELLEGDGGSQAEGSRRRYVVD